MIKKILNRAVLVALVPLAAATLILWRHSVKLTSERDRYRQNTEALMTDMRRIQVDSTRMAVDVKTLRLTVSEFEEYRAQDAELIKRLGMRVKDLEAAARHQLLVEAPIVASVRDSVIIRDTVFVPVQSVEMVNPHIEFKGMIEDSVLTADVRIPVTLNQAVFVEYKHKFLWWRWKVKGVRQVITSDNPYAEIEYSEYIRIEKK
jgi:hypothetical protein